MLANQNLRILNKNMNKILAIDDFKENLLIIQASIKNSISNCKVLFAKSGKEGLKIAKEEQPDVILLDIMMPKMDGYEVCRKLKNDADTKNIPVIIVTALKTDLKNKIKSLDSGADAFLTKPIDTVELTAQINVMLRIKKAEDKLRNEKEILKEKVLDRTKELQESENRLKLFMNSATDNFTLWNSEMNLIEINNNALKYFPVGAEKKKVLGKNMLEISPELKNNGRYDRYLEIIKTGKPFFIDEYISDTKGKDNYLTLKAFKAGDGIGIISFDITERKQTEQELLKYRIHLEELVELRTKELEEKNGKLKHYNKLFEGREFRIKELRDRVEELEQKLGKKNS